MQTNEFKHYDGCNRDDLDNCDACRLTDTRQVRPNYSAWPLAYIDNARMVPAKWRAEFRREMRQVRNIAYGDNIKRHVADKGVLFEGEKNPIFNWREI